MLMRDDAEHRIRAYTNDLSRSGYSLITRQSLDRGSTVKASLVVYDRTFFIHGTVRHCTRLGEDKCRVGIQFDEVLTRRLDGEN